MGAERPVDIRPVLREGDPTLSAAQEAFGPGAAEDYEPLAWDADVIAAMEPLSLRQRTFVLAYAFKGSSSHGIAVRSAARAGVSHSTAARWIHTDAVSGAIRAVEMQTYRRCGIDAEWHLRELLAKYEEAEAIESPQQRIAAQVGILDRIGAHKAVDSKAADKHEHTHKHTYDEIMQARNDVLRARREEQGTEYTQ